VGNLGIARFVRSHQSQTIAAQVRRKPVCEKEHSKKKKNGNLANGGPTWEPLSSVFGQIQSGGFQELFHGQRFSSSNNPLAAQWQRRPEQGTRLGSEHLGE
jgi:hypothetical protein